jgi:anti-sigma factor ChrR (cupin superfamily)
MNSDPHNGSCIPIELKTAFAVGTLPAQQAIAFSQHVTECTVCRQELDALRPLAKALPAWPMDVMQPVASLWERLAIRIAADAGTVPLPAAGNIDDPEWEEVAPGIFCKLLSSDFRQDRVSMLVRLAPGTAYPPHEHAGVEELHLLEGELWIDERKLLAGDYNRALAGSADQRVWSETGCTCVLITSTRDRLTANTVI